MSSNTIIKAISEADIHSITSGQVIVDIVSVVKELLENALDANSKNIEVILQNYSLNGIEVKDDGDGIQEENFETLCYKNYTSKLSAFNDLMIMRSLGFRGEALNSLCFISDLSISTCSDDESGMGFKLVYDHTGQLSEKELVPHSKGTTVKVENIFKTLPVRHKNFIKNYKKQYNKVVKLIQDYCIINYDVNIKVWNVSENGAKKIILSNLGQKFDASNSNEYLNTKKLLKNCGNIFGGVSKLKGIGHLKLEFEMPERKSFIKENHYEGGVVICEGLISKTAFGFGRNQKLDNQFIYVNKRPIDYPKLQVLVNEEYRKFNNLQFPFFVINLKMPTTMLDLNVTPNKRTILVHDESNFFEAFRESLINFWDFDGMSLYSNNKSQSFSNKRKIEKDFSHTNEDMIPTDKEPKLAKLQKMESFENSASSEMSDYKLPKKQVLISSINNNDNSQQLEKEKPNISSEENKNNDYEDINPVLLKPKNSSRKLIINMPTETIVESDQEELCCESDKSCENKAKFIDDNSPVDKNMNINSNTPDLASCNEIKNSALINESESTSDAMDNGSDSISFDFSGSKSLHKLNVNRTEKYKSFQSRITSFINPVLEKSSKPTSKQSISSFEDDSDQLIVELDGQKYVDSISPPRKLATPNSKRSQLLEPITATNNEATSSNAELKTKLRILFKESVEKTTVISGLNLSELNKSFFFDIAKIDKTKLIHLVDEKNSTSNFKKKKRTLYSTNDNIEQNNMQEELLTLTVSKQDFLNMKIIGQFNLGFILCTRKLSSGYDMFIIDQHASDEKFNFEQLARSTIIKGQTLIKPILLELNIMDKLVVTENEKVFLQNGFKIIHNTDGDEQLYLTTLPLSEKTQFTIEDFYELIDLIKHAEASYKDVNTVKCSKVRSMFAMRACRMSIMIGKPLNIVTMNNVVNNLSLLDKPWNCPHGRPTIRHLMELKSYNSFDEDYQL
ncbi:hypothetical protein QEN19_004342 [Hanseniaspora menglaensis]